MYRMRCWEIEDVVLTEVENSVRNWQPSVMSDSGRYCQPLRQTPDCVIGIGVVSPYLEGFKLILKEDSSSEGPFYGYGVPSSWALLYVSNACYHFPRHLVGWMKGWWCSSDVRGEARDHLFRKTMGLWRGLWPSALPYGCRAPVGGHSNRCKQEGEMMLKAE